MDDEANGRPVVSIGMLCYNEAVQIERVVTAFLAQDVFVDRHTEFIVVPNGCTDDTADLARGVIEDAATRFGSTVSLRVEELETAGKANAWNEFVHKLSRKDADILVLVDADIEVDRLSGVSDLVSELVATPGTVLLNSTPIKDLASKEGRSLKESIILKGGGTLTGVSGVCGQLYAAHADVLRGIFMPRGLPVEDGFLGGVLATNTFRSPPDLSKCRFSDRVSHTYESEREITALVRHQERIIVGAAINSHLFGYLSALSDDTDKAAALRAEEASNPDWIEALIAKNVAARSRPVVPPHMLTKRGRKWLNASMKRKFQTGPVVAAGLLMDALVYRNARARLIAGKGVGHW